MQPTTTADALIDDRISIREVLKELWSKLIAFLQFLAGRLLYAIATLLLIIFLSFFGLEMARGAAFTEALNFGLNSTVDYLGRLITWDLGTAFAAGFGERRLPVTQIAAETLPRSLGLLAVSLGVAAVIGITLGTLAAGRRGIFKHLSLPIVLFSLVGISLPTFFLALLLQIGVISLTRATGSTFISVGGFGWDDHLILPALVLAARPIAQLTRITSVTLSRILRQDFVRTASGKGLGGEQIWWRHIWPNSAIPIMTTIGTSVRFALSSLPVVELFFGWPGVGFVLLRAIARQDDLLTVALALILGTIFIVTNFVLEAGYRLLDPRLREKSSEQTPAPNLAHSLATALAGLVDAIRGLPLLRRWFTTAVDPSPEGADRVRPTTNRSAKTPLEAHIRRERRKTWLRATIGSLPFVAGALMLMGLLALYVAGPTLSPANPYNTTGISKIDGIITVPPFPPSESYSWGSDALGRDILSLVLSGAQQTLTLVALVMLARLLVGFILGTLAGWQQDRLLDRAIMSINEVFAALPTLIFAMILILALGIRRGVWVFVVALCFVGWGEMMQFVRSEVIVIRKQLYVESATALGARFSGIVIRHVLPNLLPALISLAALEMGAVAMLLGELGFIGIFIGGGTFTEVAIGGPPYHYSDVPEWGALLSNVRTYARSYAWTAFPPAMAFFLAILAFNLFGEGLRRLVQDVGLSFNRVFNRYTLGVVVVLVFGLRWVENNTGQTVFFRQQAEAFSRAEVSQQFKTLTDPAMRARAIGTTGATDAAHYIAAKFEEYGLQPAGKKNTYFFDVKRDFFSLSQKPQFNIVGGPDLGYREDFAEIPLNLLNASPDLKTGELVVLLTGDQVFSGNRRGRNFSQAVAALDLADKAVLLLDNGGFMPNDPRQGTFYLTRNPDNLTQRDSLSAYSPQAPSYTPLAGSPFFYVSEGGAEKLLASSDWSLAQLTDLEKGLAPEEVRLINTGIMVQSSLPGEVNRQVPVSHVIGYWPGLDETLDSNLLVVLAQYDGLGTDATGVAYPAANQTGSGIAVMLETIRALKATNYQPKKTIIFVAYAGEGFDYRQTPSRTPDVARFISAKFGFAASFTPEAFIFLEGVGAGSGRGLSLISGGNIRLAQHFEHAARQMGVRSQRANEAFNLDVIFGGANRAIATDAPTITLTWAGADRLVGTPADTPANVDPVKLEQTGLTLTYALAVMGREISY